MLLRSRHNAVADPPRMLPIPLGQLPAFLCGKKAVGDNQPHLVLKSGGVEWPGAGEGWGARGGIHAPRPHITHL